MFIRKYLNCLIIIFCFISLSISSGEQKDEINIMAVRPPNDGVLPDSKVDDNGILHVVYLHEKTGGNQWSSLGEVYYVQSKDGGKSFEKPIKACDSKGGRFRGPLIALGKNNRIHVATPEVMYTRMSEDGTKFEPTRHLQKWTFGADGIALTADGSGKVYLSFHALSIPGTAGKMLGGEKYRRVVLVRSEDDGSTFSQEKVISANIPMEVCACCGMAALSDSSGNLILLYRDATNNDRDMYLLFSKDYGFRFSGHRLSGETWKLAACPMTGTSLNHNKPGDVVSAWQTKEQIFWTFLNRSDFSSNQSISVPTGEQVNYPTIAVNNKDMVVVAWREDAQVRWQAYDRTGKTIGDTGKATGGKGKLSVCAFPDGKFLIVY